MSGLLLQGGRVIDPSQNFDGIADLLILDGTVAVLGDEAAARAPADVLRLDVRGLVVCPGLIDMHVHLREPGQSAKETIATGTRAAARGGFTSVVCMPNTRPPVDDPATVALIHEKAAAQGAVNVFATGAITKGLAGEELAPIGSLHQAGVVALTDDGHCVQNHEIMRRVMEYGRMFGLPVLDHCQDYSLVTDGVAHEGKWSLMLGLRGWPAAGEEMIVARNMVLAELTGTPVHCQHLSSATSVELLRLAKSRGIPLSGEACPHHFTLTDAALAGSEIFWAEPDGRELPVYEWMRENLPQWPSYDTHLKVNPPIRSARDREAILEAVADGTIEVIASDHAPHCNFEKEMEFDYAPFGMIGLETELALAVTQLVQPGRMKLADLIARFTIGPARLLKLSKGTLKPGADADVTILDPDRRWVYRAAEGASLAANTPFDGWTLQGKAMATIVGGNIVWCEETLAPSVKKQQAASEAAGRATRL